MQRVILIRNRYLTFPAVKLNLKIDLVRKVGLNEQGHAGVLDSMRVSDANEPSSSAKPSTEHATRARGERLSSPPIAIDARDSKGASRSKTRKKSSKLSFPAPSIEMVKQAFNMLDPTGSGAVNPYALREVRTRH